MAGRAAPAVLARTTFETSRLLEFFTDKELRMQIGHGQYMWPIALLKELIDNALDACEAASIPPVVDVEVTADAFRVRDNGPGLPSTTLERSLDYAVRVSDNAPSW
jgi:DNA topoisomerase VI subunit B